MKRYCDMISRLILPVSIMFCCIMTGCSRTSDNENTFRIKTDYQYMNFDQESPSYTNCTEDESGNLYYLNSDYIYKYDIHTGTNKPLCNKPDCLHDKETDPKRFAECNAFCPYQIAFDGSRVLSYENGYIYYSDSQNMTSTTEKLSLATNLVRVKTDGSEKDTVHSFDTSHVNRIFHRGYYYYVYKEYDEDNNKKMSVKAYPLEGSGKEKTIYTAPDNINGYDIQDLKAYGNYIFFMVRGDTGDGKKAYIKEISVNLSNGKTSEIKAPGQREDIDGITYGDSVSQITFFNDNVIFYVDDGEMTSRIMEEAKKNTKKGKKISKNPGYTVDLYEADLDGSNVNKIPIRTKSGNALYSDSEHLIISDDYSIESQVLDGSLDEAPGKAEYIVYDREYKQVDTYTEELKDSMQPSDNFPLYYVPLGSGEKSFLVLRNRETGAAEVYIGDKSCVGSLNGSAFPRKKVAETGKTPAEKYYEENLLG